MKKYIVFFYLILLNFANSEQKIAYIDMKKILNTSSVGIKLTKEIEKKISKENKKFNSIERQLKKEEKDLSQKKNILSKEEFNKKLSSLKNKVEKYNKDKNNSLNKFMKKESKKHFPAEGEATLCGTLVKCDDETGLATNVENFIFGRILKNYYGELVLTRLFIIKRGLWI